MADAKHSHYLFKPTGEVFPALKHPAGYEDAHPEDWEPAEAPQSETVPPPPPADLVPTIPPIPVIPPLAPPPSDLGDQLEDTNLD